MQAEPPSGTPLPLVGREQELAAIEAALARTARDRGARFLAIAGALGLGKSRLLSELGLRAERDGALVLAGSGVEFESGSPYGVLVDALGDYLVGVGERELARLGDGIAGELAPVFGEFGGAAPVAPGLQAERYRTHRALRELLARLAGRQSLVLLVDDLHWADAESVELISHLMRRPPAGAVLVAVAYRPGWLGGPLPAALVRAEREQLCDLLELEPLTSEQAGELISGAVPPARRERVVVAGGGNPFFLEQLSRAGGRTMRERVEPGSVDEGVPRAVLAALRGELEALDEGERALLGGGAVAGEPFEIDLAAAAAGIDRDGALVALDALLARDLVRSTDAPLRFSFRHPLVRRATYQAQGEGWRVAAHSRAAAALRERGAVAEAMADHVMRSSAPGDEGAIGTLVGAANAVALRAPATAARWFQAALELLPAHDERRLELLVSLATALGSAGRLEDARATLLAAIDAMPDDAPELRARAATFVARVDHALGRQGEARLLLERALGDLPQQRSRAAATLELELAMDQLFSAELGPVRDRAQAVLELAQELGDPLVEAAAWAGVAHAEQNLGHVGESAVAAARSAAIVDGLPDADCAPLLETFWWLASAEDVIERWDDCLRHAERGMRLAREYGVSFVFVALTHTLAVTLGWQGALDRAREAALETVDAAHLSGSEASIAYAYTTQCFVHARAGEAREAVRGRRAGRGGGARPARRPAGGAAARQSRRGADRSGRAGTRPGPAGAGARARGAAALGRAVLVGAVDVRGGAGPRRPGAGRGLAGRGRGHRGSYGPAGTQRRGPNGTCRAGARAW